jgi:hypothetical protein
MRLVVIKAVKAPGYPAKSGRIMGGAPAADGAVRDEEHNGGLPVNVVRLQRAGV